MVTTDRTKNEISLEEEAKLVQRAIQGDQDALVEIYEQTVDTIYRYFYRRARSVSEAESLTMETFTRAIEQLMSGNYNWQGKPFRVWLFGIARNVLKEWIREEMKLPMIEALDDIPEHYDVEDEEGDPLNLMVQQEEEEALWRLVRALPDAEQRILILRYAQKLSYAEIAQRLKRSENACKQLHYRALNSLRQKAQQAGLRRGANETM